MADFNCHAGSVRTKSAQGQVRGLGPAEALGGLAEELPQSSDFLSKIPRYQLSLTWSKARVRLLYDRSRSVQGVIFGSAVSGKVKLQRRGLSTLVGMAPSSKRRHTRTA